MVDFKAHTARAIAVAGDRVTITPAGQAARVVAGVHSADPATAFNLIDGFTPIVRLTAADAAGLTHGDPVVANGVSYVAERIRPDAVAGDVLIELRAA